MTVLPFYSEFIYLFAKVTVLIMVIVLWLVVTASPAK